MQIQSFGARAANEKSQIVSLHGFPGVRSRQNRDIAQALASETKRPVDVLLYTGLGFAEGNFSFAECLEDVRRYVSTRMSEGIERFDLIGHSWGGFLSLVLAAELGVRIDHLVLMSPLLQFAVVGQVEPFFQEKARENPTLAIQDHVVLAREFETLSREYSTTDLIAKIPSSVKVLFLQARGDDVTPEVHAHEAVKHFVRTPRFELVDTDHSFVTGREKISLHIASFLNS